MAHLEWRDDANHIVAVFFDAVRSVDHRQNANVTKHPVQRGADISDHVRVELPRVSVTGTVSIAPLFANSAIGGNSELQAVSGRTQRVTLARPPVSPVPSRASLLQGGFLSAATSLVSRATSPKDIDSLVTDEASGRVAKMTAVLMDDAQLKRRLIRFVDEAKTYQNMVIASLAITRTNQFRGAAVALELEQIRIVDTRLVDRPVPVEVRAKPTISTAGSAKSKGSTEAEESSKSAALKAAEKLFSFGGL